MHPTHIHHSFRPVSAIRTYKSHFLDEEKRKDLMII